MTGLKTTIVAFSFAAFATAALAADPVQQHNSSAVWFENWQGLSNATMTIYAPTGKITVIEAKSGTPVYQLDRAETVDGIYRYDLTAATEETVKIVNPINNGRGDAQSDSHNVPFAMSGSFVVSRGVIVTPEIVSEDQG